MKTTNEALENLKKLQNGNKLTVIHDFSQVIKNTKNTHIASGVNNSFQSEDQKIIEEDLEDIVFSGHFRNIQFNGTLKNIIFENSVNNIVLNNEAKNIKFNNAANEMTFKKRASNIFFNQTIMNIIFKEKSSEIHCNAQIVYGDHIDTGYKHGLVFERDIEDIFIAQPESIKFCKINAKGINFSKTHRIKNCDFSDAIFEDVLDLSGCTIEQRVYFCKVTKDEITNPATFKQPPNFINTQFGDFGNDNSSDTHIDKVNFDCVQHNGKPYAIKSWKVLQNYYASIGNSEGARKFFELELKEKTKKPASGFIERIEKYTNVTLTYLYGKLSDYGYSVSKPFVGLLIILLIYIYTGDFKTALNKISPIDFSGTYYLVTQNSEVIVQKISTQLGNWGYFFHFLLKIFSLIFWFLLGLGIRNKYKIK